MVLRFVGMVGLMALAMGCAHEEKPLVILQAPTPPAAADATVRKEIRRIAFGSCASPADSMPALRTALDRKPDVFVWLGDNIYGDTHNMDTLQRCYDRLAEHPDFQALKSSVRMMATWDDHDYGWNDAGAEYPEKRESKKMFLSFWEEPMRSPRRQREGIYTSTLFDGARLDVLVILLDTRSFRSSLRLAEGVELLAEDSTTYDADYLPHNNPAATMLGEAQWTWLERQLEIPCDVRVIGSSTQFGIAYNGYEAWANFPHEQRRMLGLLDAAAARDLDNDSDVIPTCFISGDVHYGELSELTVGADQLPVPERIRPLYDLTSSGITSTWFFATKNANRVKAPVMENNVGLLTFLADDTTMVRGEIWDAEGTLRLQHLLASR